MSTPFIGQVVMFAGNFAPRGWAFCNGQLLAISKYSALFSILGTTYGGDGQTTFALPDLRGRVPLSPGQGPGLTNHPEGAKAGSETNTLMTANIPSMNGSLRVYNGDGDTNSPMNNAIAGFGTALPPAGNFSTNAPNGVAAAGSVQVGGSSIPVNNMQPYLSIYFIIATEGIFPSRG